jgi:transposase
MQSMSTISLDIAKSVFQVHGANTAGQAVLPTPAVQAPAGLGILARTSPCLVGIEACVSLSGFATAQARGPIERRSGTVSGLVDTAIKNA